MKSLNKQDNQITVQAEVSESLANAIRRYINHIPVLAIDEVEISKNDSPLYDETVAHRLGLVPLKNGKTTSDLKINVKKEGAVYSGDLKGDIEVVYDNIPITTILGDQEVKITATTKIGKGFEHSKFSPGLMYYRSVSEITMPKEFSNEIKAIFPNNDVKEKGDKIVVLNDQKKDVGDVCEGICEKAGKEVTITFKKDLILTLESFGQMSLQDIFKKSVDELKKNLQAVSKKVK